jgi:hypothetical protein
MHGGVANNGLIILDLINREWLKGCYRPSSLVPAAHHWAYVLMSIDFMWDPWLSKWHSNMSALELLQCLSTNHPYTFIYRSYPMFRIDLTGQHIMKSSIWCLTSDLELGWLQCQVILIAFITDKSFNSVAFVIISLNLHKKNSVVWVLNRTIPTERPPLVGKVSANFSR